MKTFSLILCFVGAASFCFGMGPRVKGNQPELPLGEPRYIGYIALESPITLDPELTPQNGANNPGCVTKDRLAHTDSHSSIKESRADGTIRYAVANQTLQNCQYLFTLDNMRYVNVSVTFNVTRPRYSTDAALQKVFPAENGATRVASERDEAVVNLYIGVAVRAQANFRSKEANANIGTFPSLGISANAKAIEGMLSFKCLGINSQSVNSLIPEAGDISMNTIATAQSATKLIKDLIDNPATKLTPTIIGIDLVNYPKAVSPQDVISALHAEKTYVMQQIRQQLIPAPKPDPRSKPRPSR